jgi:hypothetical protein
MRISDTFSMPKLALLVMLQFSTVTLLASTRIPAARLSWKTS